MVSERVGQRRLSSTLHNNFCHFVGKQQFFGHFVLQELNKQMCFFANTKKLPTNQELEPQNHPNWKGTSSNNQTFCCLHVCVGPQNLWNLLVTASKKRTIAPPPKILGGTFFRRFWAWWSLGGKVFQQEVPMDVPHTLVTALAQNTSHKVAPHRPAPPCVATKAFHVSC